MAKDWHKTLDALRKALLRHAHLYPATGAPPQEGPGREAAARARSAERVTRLDACLGRLEAPTRAVLLDVRLSGMSFKEAGEVHGISPADAQQQVAHATFLLAKWMEDWQD